MYITLIWTITMVIVTLLAVKSAWEKEQGVLGKMLLVVIILFTLFSATQIFLKFLPFWG